MPSWLQSYCQYTCWPRGLHLKVVCVWGARSFSLPRWGFGIEDSVYGQGSSRKSVNEREPRNFAFSREYQRSFLLLVFWETEKSLPRVCYHKPVFMWVWDSNLYYYLPTSGNCRQRKLLKKSNVERAAQHLTETKGNTFQEKHI